MSASPLKLSDEGAPRRRFLRFSPRHFDRSEAERRNLLLSLAALRRGFLRAPAARAWSK
jgi:hypothetical protein